jgi:hypothetical protein
MAYEITNSLRAKSTIRITGNTATTIELADLAASAAETIANAKITFVASSTDGKWTIRRGGAGGTIVLELFGETYLPLTQSDIVVANNSGSNLYFTNSGSGGTLICSVTKDATYSPALTGM